MQLEIIPMKYPPCKLRIFTINGKESNVDNFGHCGTDGDGTCIHTFTPYEIPDHNLLEKYEISKEEYREICEKLKDKLYINGCGWCS